MLEKPKEKRQFQVTVNSVFFFAQPKNDLNIDGDHTIDDHNVILDGREYNIIMLYVIL